MKFLNRHTFAWLLAWSSVGLLVAFQGFWLVKSYDEQAELLRKQTDNLFQQTVRQMQDSLFEQMIAKPIRDVKSKQIRSLEFRSLQPLPKPVLVAKQAKPSGSALSEGHFVKDTATALKLNLVIRPDSSNTSIRFFRNTTDTSLKSLRMSKLSAEEVNTLLGVVKASQRGPVTISLKDSVKKLIVRQKDSLSPSAVDQVVALKSKIMAVSSKVPSPQPRTEPKQFASGIVLTVQQSGGAVPFTIKLKTDSLRIADISRRYASVLSENGLGVPVMKIQRTTNAKLQLLDGGFRTSSVASNEPPGQYYVASFSNYKWFLFQKIIPQVLFSMLLIGLTGLAFGLILKSLGQQRRLAALKNDFISNVTHELKTPIATVGVAIEALRSFDAIKDPARTQEYLDISRNELNRLSMLVDKVLKMSMFEGKALEIKPEPVDVRQLVDEILLSMKLQFEKYRAELRFEVIGERFELSADRTHLTSVVYNLLDNALKYCHQRPVVELKLETIGDTLWLSVQDNGPGIEPAYQQRIFEKFFRVPQGDQHNVKGHGLGLSYVASVVSQHGGVISLRSTVGQGSCFVVMLPLSARA